MNETELECPKCGEPLEENDHVFACAKDEEECGFKIFKNNKLLGETIDVFMFQQLNSEDGYEFSRGVMRIDVDAEPFYTKVDWKQSSNNFEVKKEFHLHEFTSKAGVEMAIWKDEIQDESEDRGRKSIFKKFIGHDITEEEAKELFAGETIEFTDLVSKAGKEFKAPGSLQYDEERSQWGINLQFN